MSCKKKFIVIEGLDGIGKSTLIKGLKKEFKQTASVMACPPVIKCEIPQQFVIKCKPQPEGRKDITIDDLFNKHDNLVNYLKEGIKLRDVFDNSKHRREYYEFANRVASELVEKELKKRHVIMDRYWTSTAAYSCMDKPPDSMKKWYGKYPEIKNPDLLILLSIDEKIRKERIISSKERGEREGLTSEEEKHTILRRQFGDSP